MQRANLLLGLHCGEEGGHCGLSLLGITGGCQQNHPRAFAHDLGDLLQGKIGAL